MGRLKNIVLGNLDGKVGNIVGRKRKGKYFVYAKPTEFKISNSQEAIRSRNIMKPLAKFASVVNSIPELKYIWTKDKLEAFDAFHKIEKVNYPYLSAERPTLKNTITPIGLIENPIQSGSISESGILLNIIFGEKNIKQLEGTKDLTGVGVVCYFNPYDKEPDYFRLGKIRTGTFDMQKDEPFEIDISFNEEERRKYNSYLQGILYFAFVSKDINGTPIKATNSCSIEFAHEIVSEKERFKVCDSRP